MIKISKDTKDTKLGSKQVVKVMQGIDVVWEKNIGTLVYSDKGAYYYSISTYLFDVFEPNKNYRFVTNNPDSEYVVIGNGMQYTIKNNDVFRITNRNSIKIKNADYNYYDINIYETKEEATIII